MKNVLKISILHLFILLYLPVAAFAHKPSDSYLKIDVEQGMLSGQWDIALRDLEVELGLDQNGDGLLSWGEVIQRKKELFAYSLAKLEIFSRSGRVELLSDDLMLEQHSDGMYAVLGVHSLERIDADELAVTYSLLFEIDASHRGIATVTVDGSSSSTVFSPDEPTVSFSTERHDFRSGIVPFIKSGIWHILIGFDHVLFLLTLLLPAALIWKGWDDRWQPAPDLRSTFFDVAKVITSFTIAHSITLALTVLGTISLPSRFVESVIALSVALAAINNIYPIVTKSRWGIAFLFGLIHGCGFASVLVDAGLPRANFFGALLGFNLGVEVGQLCIVAAILPLLFLFRFSINYRRVGLCAGSCVATLVSAVWIGERAFDIALF